MNKLYFLLIVFFGFILISTAQDITKDALGLRFSNSDGIGVEISYQHAFSDRNRLELDAGYSSGRRYDGFKITALDQYVWNIDGGFNWYLGAGGGLASYKFNYNTISGNSISDDYTFLFLAANIGIEYNLSGPFLIALDFRPEFGLSDSNFRDDNLDFDIGISVRYQF
jgi:hypothetical protein